MLRSRVRREITPYEMYRLRVENIVSLYGSPYMEGKELVKFSFYIIDGKQSSMATLIQSSRAHYISKHMEF